MGLYMKEHLSDRTEVKEAVSSNDRDTKISEEMDYYKERHLF